MGHLDTVASHTIQEAMKLTGKGRMTLYRHMDTGKLVYRFGLDERRYIDTAELIRVYGELKAVVHQGVSKKAKPSDTPSDLLIQLIQEVKKLKEENRKQSEELAQIRKQLEERPLLEAPREAPAPATVSEVIEPPAQEQPLHEFTSITQSLRNKQKA